MPAPHGSQNRELPIYFRLSVVAPAAASLTIVVLVIAGACLFVSHERRKYKNVPGKFQFHKGDFDYDISSLESYLSERLTSHPK